MKAHPSRIAARRARQRFRMASALAWIILFLALASLVSFADPAPIAAFAGIVAAVPAIPVVASWLRRRVNRYSSEPGAAYLASDRLARDRNKVLHEVRDIWVTRFLEHQASAVPLLVLGTRNRPDVLDPANRAVHCGSRAPVMSGETTILQVFDHGGGILITGAPGAGKTTLLVRLADALIKRAEADRQQPIPIIFNLASWAMDRKPLDAWLAREVSDNYHVSRRTASAWLDQDALALLLDGIDEVAAHQHTECVEAINAFRSEHVVPIAVCGRVREIGELPLKLKMEQAIEILPPTDAQVGSYLRRLEADGAPLADVRAAQASDPELRQLLRCPLVLQVIAIAYQKQPASALLQPGSAEDRLQRLWGVYVNRMFEHRPLPPGCSYTRGQAVSWLTWLAGRLAASEQAEFHLDRLTHEWLPNPHSSQQGLERHLITLTGEDLGQIESVRWSWTAATSNLRQVIGRDRREHISRIAAVAAAVAANAGFFAVTRVLYPTWAPAVARFMIVVAILCPIALAAGAGLTMQLRAERTMPNEGVRRSAWSAAISGLGCGLVFGVPWAWALDHAPGFYGTLLSGVGAGLIIGLMSALSFGGWACIQHYAIRRALVRAGVAPWRYASFLGDMADRMLLHRNGSGYLFIHRMLRDHLAGQSSESADLTKIQYFR